MAKEPISNGAPTKDSTNQLDAIKSIIFGAEMEKITGDLESLSTRHGQDVSELEEKLSKLEATFATDMKEMKQALLSELNTRFDSLQADLDKLAEGKADRKQLGALLVKLGEQLINE